MTLTWFSRSHQHFECQIWQKKKLVYIISCSKWWILAKLYVLLLRIKVWLSILLCAVKTEEGDFRFCWTISPNVGQTHKENPNLLRIFYMICTLNDIYKQYNKLHEHWNTKNQFTSLCRGQKPASKYIGLVYEILVIFRALQALYMPQRCELIKKKKKTLTVPIGYSLFAAHRSVPSFGPGFFCLNSWLTLPKQSLCTIFAITR